MWGYDGMGPFSSNDYVFVFTSDNVQKDHRQDYFKIYKSRILCAYIGPIYRLSYCLKLYKKLFCIKYKKSILGTYYKITQNTGQDLVLL
jgi:hypothetical protein